MYTYEIDINYVILPIIPIVKYPNQLYYNCQLPLTYNIKYPKTKEADK